MQTKISVPSFQVGQSIAKHKHLEFTSFKGLVWYKIKKQWQFAILWSTTPKMKYTAVSVGALHFIFSQAWEQQPYPNSTFSKDHNIHNLTDFRTSSVIPPLSFTPHENFLVPSPLGTSVALFLLLACTAPVSAAFSVSQLEMKGFPTGVNLKAHNFCKLGLSTQNTIHNEALVL